MNSLFDIPYLTSFDSYDFTYILLYIAIVLIFLLFLFNSSTCKSPSNNKKK